MQRDSLGRLASDIFGYVLFFRDAPDHARPSAADLRSHLSRLVDQFSAESTATALHPDELQEARFALVAWIDEMVSLCDWSGQREWSDDLLQSRLFGTNKAGDEFYERLDRLSPDFYHAREIFFLCLATGFQGGLAGDDAGRRELLTQQYDSLRAAGHAIEPSTLQVLSEPAYNLGIEVFGGKERGLRSILAMLALGTLLAFGLFLAALHYFANQVATPIGI